MPRKPIRASALAASDMPTIAQGVPPAMQNNPYQAPQSVVQDAPIDQAGEFYVVSPRKFLIMMIGTLGGYQIYWFYRNWKLQNQIHQSYWPVARAIFAVFFTHALFRAVDESLRKAQSTYVWAHQNLATIFVAAAIGSQALSRLGAKGVGSPVTDLLGFAALAPVVWALFKAQDAINHASGDPQGQSNDQITGANIGWLVLGGLLWLLSLLGLYAILTGQA
jgi:hypothetical protein